jgi:hypothetical protein
MLKALLTPVAARNTLDGLQKTFLKTSIDHILGETNKYGSEGSLNLHMKLKHGGGNKTDREKLAVSQFE